jgi:SAM-dependent methyltransferase
VAPVAGNLYCSTIDACQQPSDHRRASEWTAALDPGSFDAVISRFGVMFFDDPEAAFANLAPALRPGGRLAFVRWQDPSTANGSPPHSAR